MSYPRMIMGRLAEAWERIERAMTAAEANPELGVEFVGASLKGLMYGWQVHIQSNTARFDEVEATFERGLRWIRQRAELENEALIALEYAATVPFSFGETTRSLALARQGRAMAEELKSPILIINSLRVLAGCLLVSGDPEGALTNITEWQELSAKVGVDLQFRSVAANIRAEAECALGREDAGIATARFAVAEVERMGARSQLPQALHGLVSAHMRNAELAEADAVIDRMERSVREIGAVNLLPRCQWLRGTLRGMQGDAEGSAQFLRDALAGFLDRGATGHARSVEAELGARE
jgi:ATP/maltotriose-dependent transcriptional regulator MalT